MYMALYEISAQARWSYFHWKKITARRAVNPPESESKNVFVNCRGIDLEWQTFFSFE